VPAPRGTIGTSNSPHSLTSSTSTTSTLHCRSFRREALRARDNRFELSAGPEGRHGRWLHFHCLAGTRISRDPGCTAPLFENAETCNGDAVTLMYRTHDCVDNVLDRIGCRAAINVELIREYVDQLCFVHAKPPQQ
jgi:hypothetical protein